MVANTSEWLYRSWNFIRDKRIRLVVSAHASSQQNSITRESCKISTLFQFFVFNLFSNTVIVFWSWHSLDYIFLFITPQTSGTLSLDTKNEFLGIVFCCMLKSVIGTRLLHSCQLLPSIFTEKYFISIDMNHFNSFQKDLLKIYEFKDSCRCPNQIVMFISRSFIINIIFLSPKIFLHFMYDLMNHFSNIFLYGAP